MSRIWVMTICGIWYPTHLELLIKRLEETAADVAYAMCEIISAPGSGTKYVTGLSASGQYEPGLLVPPSSVMHRRDMIRDTGPWKDYRTIQLPPDIEFLVRAYDCGKQFAAVRELTVVKPPSTFRQNVYVEKPSHEQAEYARRIESEPDFRYRELLDILPTYLFRKGSLDNKVETPFALPPGWLVDQMRIARGLDPLLPTQSPVVGRIWSLLTRLPSGIKGRLRRVAKTLVYVTRD
jgi:hypothetical protein